MENQDRSMNCKISFLIDALALVTKFVAQKTEMVILWINKKFCILGDMDIVV